ncbi:TPA: gamma-aminobutyrate permease, partial [Staphylococcus aureus]|nr:gamma-aminobutyrate permease [Staphylococcus aureus]
EYILKDQWLNAFKNFLPLIILALIYFIHKIIHKTKFVKLETINLKPHDYDNQK